MNFAVLRSSLDTQKRKFIDASITTDVEQDFSLPSVQFHDSAQSHFLATDKENKLLMDKVGERVRNNQEIFTSLGDAILAGEIPLQSKFMSTREVLTIVLFIIFLYYDDSVFCLSMSLFWPTLKKLKKKDLEQDNVPPETVNKTDEKKTKKVAEIFIGYSKNSECTGSSFTMSEEDHPSTSGIQNIRNNEEGSCTSEELRYSWYFFYIWGDTKVSWFESILNT